MYFATGTAKTLSTRSKVPNEAQKPVIGISANARKTLFCLWTEDYLTVCRFRPTVMLACLVRSQVSLDEHGVNVAAAWSTDGGRIVIKTSLSHIVLVNVVQTPDFTPYSDLYITSETRMVFFPGPGEGPVLSGLSLDLEGVIKIDGELVTVSPRTSFLMFSTRNPAAVQRIPWPNTGKTTGSDWLGHETWLLDSESLPWLLQSNVTLDHVHLAKTYSPEGWITSDGRAYFVRLTRRISVSSDELGSQGTNDSGDQELIDSGEVMWNGSCIYPILAASNEEGPPGTVHIPAMRIAINTKFSVVAIGLQDGSLRFASFPLDDTPSQRHREIRLPDLSSQRRVGYVTDLEWTSDGYALAIGWQHGWGVVSVGGRVLAWGVGTESSMPNFQDQFMRGISHLFWGPGNFELCCLSTSSLSKSMTQLCMVSFAKSNITTQQSPENTRYAFLQMDDRVLVYRGADQPDMSVINPESDVWQHIKLPIDYIANNWPLRYSSISNDGRLIAVAGRRGLIHYSMASGRWKLFAQATQEQSFSVRGGLVWFHHVLIVAVELASKVYQIRLYSRDMELSDNSVLHTEVFPSPIISISLIDNSLLVYTADNDLYHYLVLPTADAVALHICGSITFNGVVMAPNLVRGMSWMIPSAQKNFGDPSDDLMVATILLLVGGQLVLLRPRKSGAQDVKYDLQILAERMEFCWIHLRGIGALENSLWGYDGDVLRIWLDALTIDPHSRHQEEYIMVRESVSIPLEFYPLSVLMDKGIIIGAEQETAIRSTLPFAMFRHVTSSHLFLHHVLHYHLRENQVDQAVAFASHYQALIFFAHALEILLHTVLESDEEETQNEDTLSKAVEFLDHFDASLEVVVACARKTEMARWNRLFAAVGSPKSLFEACLRNDQLRFAASYLFVLHNLQVADETKADAIRLLSRAIQAQEWDISKDLMRFLKSIDEKGELLQDVLTEVGLDIPNSN